LSISEKEPMVILGERKKKTLKVKGVLQSHKKKNTPDTHVRKGGYGSSRPEKKKTFRERTGNEAGRGSISGKKGGAEQPPLYSGRTTGNWRSKKETKRGERAPSLQKPRSARKKRNGKYKYWNVGEGVSSLFAGKKKKKKRRKRGRGPGLTEKKKGKKTSRPEREMLVNYVPEKLRLAMQKGEIFGAVGGKKKKNVCLYKGEGNIFTRGDFKTKLRGENLRRDSTKKGKKKKEKGKKRTSTRYFRPR